MAPAPQAEPRAASPAAQRLARALLRSMQACTRAPGWLDALKAPWLATALLLLELPGLRHALADDEVRSQAGFKLAGPLREAMLNRVLAYRGEFEPGLTRFIQAHVQPGELCVDIGANVGYFSLLLAQCVGEAGQVLAVEAAPGNVRRLRRNVAANDWASRIEVVHAACTDFSGHCTFHVHTRNDMHCRLSLPGAGEPDAWLTGRRHWQAVQVRAATLAELLGERAAQVRFLKLDIEGAEPQVVPQVLAHCTHARLCVALEAKAPHIRATLAPFEQAGFFLYDLHNDYRWLFNRRPPRPPTPLSYAQAYARRYMVDVLVSRQPLHMPTAPGA